MDPAITVQLLSLAGCKVDNDLFCRSQEFQSVSFTLFVLMVTSSSNEFVVV